MAQKKTAVAMIGGCETGLHVLRADELLTSGDTTFYRQCVRSAVEMVVSCANCQGNPDSVDDPEAYPCPLDQDEANAVMLSTIFED